MANETWISQTVNTISLIQSTINAFVWVSNRLGRCPSIMKAQEPLLISSDKYNHQFISAKFFDWEKCSIMMWVFIPPQGECIRKGSKNSYIVSHIKGDIESNLQRNLFAIRYSPSKNWELVFTNEKGSETPESLAIKDGLSDGWHHFLVSWVSSQ